MTRNEAARARFGMSIADAVVDKFLVGREQYGDKWKGDHPLVEAHDDALDVLAYLDQAESREDADEARISVAKQTTQYLINMIRRAAEQSGVQRSEHG